MPGIAELGGGLAAPVACKTSGTLKRAAPTPPGARCTVVAERLEAGCGIETTKISSRVGGRKKKEAEGIAYDQPTGFAEQAAPLIHRPSDW